MVNFMPNTIQACKGCGSAAVTPLARRDNMHYCPACGWTGVPVGFGDRRSYQAFLDGLRLAIG